MSANNVTDPYDVFDRYHERIHRFVTVVVKDAWLADDIAQETFVRAMQHAAGIRDPAKLSAWLFRVAHNLCLDHFRKAARRPTEAIEDLVAMPPDDLPGADTEMERHEMSACVQRQVEKLEAPYRSVIWLFDVQGFSLREIAAILDISLANVKVRLHRARKQFKGILVENCALSKDRRDVLVCEPKTAVVAEPVQSAKPLKELVLAEGLKPKRG